MPGVRGAAANVCVCVSVGESVVRWVSGCSLTWVREGIAIKLLLSQQ